MLQCHYADPARKKIASLQSEGKSDQDILDAFVKESGLSALAVPPTEGFSLLAWVMPFVGVGLGMFAISLYIKRYHPKRAAAAMPEMDPEVLARYRDRIDKEVSKLE
jgi:cytochrome c-type biogenesis protein CcmH